MGSVRYFVLAGMICFVQAQTFEIKKEFIDGNLIFTWTNVSTRRNDILITKDGSKSSWIQITDDKYTVEDAWKYKSVKLLVREYPLADHRSYKDYYSTYTVSRIDSQEGDTTNLTFTADFIPNSGEYDIYHFYDDTSNRIIQVTSNMTSSTNYSKYAYHTRPYTSTDITFEVKNITLMDAGYYGIRTTEIAARSGQGVVLVVKGKPTQPEIVGILKVQETSDVTLTCSSNSTSRPSYYRKTISLSYIWYMNNTVIDSETRLTLRFPRISRGVRFNKYSCQAKESIVSENSEEIQMNVLYLSKPTMMINGTKEENVDVHEGESLNISCSVDGNPNPNLNISRDVQEQNLKTRTAKSIEVFKRRVQCDDTDTYKCTASSPGFADNHTGVTLNVLCRTRMDTDAGFKTSYGSRSGIGVAVIVKTPIISNPKPSPNLISWSGPRTANIQNQITERGAVIYKHWITSTIPVNNQTYFGNYNMTYNGEIIFTITIKAEELTTSDNANAIPTTTVVIVILSTLLVVTMGTVAGIILQRKMRNQQHDQRPQTDSECNTTGTGNRQRLQRDAEFPLHEYDEINSAGNRDGDWTATIDQERLKLESDGGYELPIHEYVDINAVGDNHTYDKVSPSKEAPYEDVQTYTNT